MHMDMPIVCKNHIEKRALPPFWTNIPNNPPPLFLSFLLFNILLRVKVNFTALVYLKTNFPAELMLKINHLPRQNLQAPLFS